MPRETVNSNEDGIHAGRREAVDQPGPDRPAAAAEGGAPMRFSHPAVCENISASLEARGVSVCYPVRQRTDNLLKRLSGIGAGSGHAQQMADRRRDVLALDNVSVSIAKGERVGLVGVNGSGKTTLLKSLSGCLPPTSGRIEVRGRLISFINVGFGVDGNLTGAENLDLRIQYWGLDRKRTSEYAAEIADFTELGDFFHLPVKTYSAGMKARLFIGLSMLVDPDILVMDEWISLGDRTFLAKANKRLEQFVSGSGILLFATHSHDLLLKWSTRLVWLDRGTVRADGDPRSVLAQYQAGR